MRTLLWKDLTKYSYSALASSFRIVWFHKTNDYVEAAHQQRCCCVVFCSDYTKGGCFGSCDEARPLVAWRRWVLLGCVSVRWAYVRSLDDLCVVCTFKW